MSFPPAGICSKSMRNNGSLPFRVRQLKIRSYLHDSSLPPVATTTAAAKTTETAIIAIAVVENAIS